MNRSFRTFLEDIREAAEKIAKYIEGLDYTKFMENDMVCDAVVRNLEIAGEAARNISDELRTRYSQIPWRQLVGLRNIMIHAYFGVDYENIWKIVSEELPAISSSISTILQEEQ